jgi:aerobic carbon-monoxide dehydrogenase medium subunit
MRLTPFRLHRPETIEEASELLRELAPTAVPYCGVTELLLVAKLGLTDFTDLVDIKAIEELSGIEADGELRIGATTTHRQIKRSQVVRERWPSLAAMERGVGNLRVRNVGTIGGNLCFADPHSDPATYLIAAGGSVSARRAGGEARRIPIEEFTPGPYENAPALAELLIAVYLTQPTPGSALVHRKLSCTERPAITVAAAVTVRDGRLADACLAIGSVGMTANRMTAAERALVDLDALEPSGDQLAASAEAAASAAEPVADASGSVEYKRQLVRVLTVRCVREALTQAAAA